MRIKKITETAPTQASVVGTYNNSQTDSYSCKYSNEHFGGTLLWENPDPTSAMHDDTITLSSDDYDILEVYYKVRNQNDTWGSCRVPKGCQIGLFNGGYFTSVAGYMRTISRTDDTHFNSGACFGYNKDQSFEDNYFLIPVYIIGYKTNIFN